jgi:HAD superfamily hydrolase (TIGR01549 family)
VALPRVVLLDVGGTLLVEHGYDLVSGVTELLRAPDLAPLFGSGSARARAEALAAAIDRVHANNRAEFTLAGWLAEELAGQPDLDLAALERRFWDRLTSLSAMPGVHAAMAALRARGVRLAAVSNAVFASQTMIYGLERHGLRSSLEFLISSADHGIRKPDPEIFRIALARWGVAAEEAWYVGDSWPNDVEGAAAAGMRPVWFAVDSDRAAPPSEVDPVRVASWLEFESFLASEDGNAQ